MYNARTIICGNIISGNNAESQFLQFHEAVNAGSETFFGMCCGIFLHESRRILVHPFCRFYPRHQLSITHTHQLGALPFSRHAPRHRFVTGFVSPEVSILRFRFEISMHKVFGNHHGYRFATVRIESFNRLINE